MEKIVKQFNEIFGKSANAVIEKNDLKITIGTKTMTINLLLVVGVDSKAP